MTFEELKEKAHSFFLSTALLLLSHALFSSIYRMG